MIDEERTTMDDTTTRDEGETLTVAIGELPPAWADLIRGLVLLARGRTNTDGPLHCEHDQLTVRSAPAAYTRAEIDQLDRLGFFVAEDGDGDSFTSFRFGSA
jgi:hypothetical protein